MPDAPLRILFLGTPEAAVPALRALAADPRFAVDLVITQPDRPAGRKRELKPPAVKDAATHLGLPVFQPERLNRELETVQRMLPGGRPDFAVVIAYGQILSQAALDLAMIAPVNVHFSLLPRWRGASPVQHAILASDRETGVTVQRMVKELDAGPILSQRTRPLDGTETTPQLIAELAETGARLLTQTLTQPLHPVDQEASAVTLCRTLSRQDGTVDHTAMTALELDRHVRALTPWPGVLLTVDGQPLKILQSALEATEGSAPLPCAERSVLHVVTVQAPGKKPMSGRMWAAGKR